MKVKGASALVLLGLVSGCSGPCAHFEMRQVAPGIFNGCRPRTQADFATLRRLGIKTILNFESFNWHIAPERRLTLQNGIAFTNVPVFASPLGPSEATVKRAVSALADPGLRPVYVHCLYGRDRTEMLIGLYRMYYLEWPAETAWQKMLDSGFKCDWSLWGFKHYFWRHTQKPEWARRSGEIGVGGTQETKAPRGGAAQTLREIGATGR